MRASAADAAFLVGLKLVLGAFVLHLGFSHVSDDDYARTVIAEQFAHTARLDPSGTSWLPLPFWISGAVMALAGRTLAVARAVAVVLGAASVLAPYAAMRAAGMARVPALVATALALALPWNVWLGVATVPEAWASALLAGAILAMRDDRARPWAAAALLAAALSRYEAWPACAVCAVLCAARAWRWPAPAQRRREWLWAALAILGPLGWMAWNAHAHGSAVHFLARVSNFRRATGAADVPWRDKLLAYPLALARESPEAAALGAVGALALVLDPPFRARWGWAGASVAATLAFLIEGDLRDGAPTHHPERALASLWWVLLALGIDALARAGSRLSQGRPGWLGTAFAGASALALLAWAGSLILRLGAYPGASEWDRRESQIARGEAMRARGVAAAAITPCSYEHFALLAAWGEPERALVAPPLHVPPTPDCPRVLEHE